MPKPLKDNQLDVPLDILEELLTDSEWRMIKQRLLVISLLKQGLSVRQIASQAGVGTDTVVRMSKRLEGSYKLRKYFEQPANTSTSKWIFGQVSEEE